MAITDRVRFAGRSFDLVRVVGPPLLDPSQHGLVVASGLPPCPRGFFGLYDLEPRLTLHQLHVRLTDDALATPLAGVHPVRGVRHTRRLVGGRWVLGDWPTWDHVYRDLAMPRPFTGSLWLGADRVPGADPLADPLLRYRYVWDVWIEDGRLAAALDRSPEVAGARMRYRADAAPAFDRLH